MKHKSYWQLFTESGDPLAYLDYRESMEQDLRKKRAWTHENI